MFGLELVTFLLNYAKMLKRHKENDIQLRCTQEIYFHLNSNLLIKKVSFH